MLSIEKITDNKGQVLVQDPPIARFLFQSSAASWLWLVVRVWVGYQWLHAGWEKFVNPAWMDGSGAGILGFWKGALAVNNGKAVTTYDWYRGFLQFLVDANAAPWFTKVIVFGEIAVGIGLIVGAFVGLAAAGGLLMNVAFMLAGTASTNPIMAIGAILLILAWKNAGYIGLDRYLLPAIGTPWWHQLPRITTREPAMAPAH